jgi:hypothetical protein
MMITRGRGRPRITGRDGARVDVSWPLSVKPILEELAERDFKSVRDLARVLFMRGLKEMYPEHYEQVVAIEAAMDIGGRTNDKVASRFDAIEADIDLIKKHLNISE